MASESKLANVDTVSEEARASSALSNQIDGKREDDENASSHEPASSSSGKGKEQVEKKESKASRLKNALTPSTSSDDSKKKGESKLPESVMAKLLEMNPSLRGELAGLDSKQAADRLRSLDTASLISGMSIGGKNQKDMASYKFWQTQPVPRFDEDDTNHQNREDGPIKRIDPEKVPAEPSPMLEGFEWVTMDLTQDEQLKEVYELLTGHYVEDDEAMFRFNYSVSFLNWALKSPGWRKEWHVGVRAAKSRKLVAFISGVPVQLRIRSRTLKSIEINFLCVHKKLRSKRLAPVLIQEITRRCYRLGIYQAIYTAGVVLPKPVSSCRYFHRSINWLKLYDVGFCGLPTASTKARQVTRYTLPNKTNTAGLRPMKEQDIVPVQELLDRFLKRSDMAPAFDANEISHWLLHQTTTKSPEQVIWCYVVEDPESRQITDFFSFYCLESQVIGNKKHQSIRAAYLFYYATTTAFNPNETGLKERLNVLIGDALILAKQADFDVFNALTLLDNPLFLEQQKFGPGDGQLHYYLYNYRTAPLAGGVNASNQPDAAKRGGIGVVML